MSSKKFTNWSESDLLVAIRELENALASGVASASYPGGGQISYVTRDRMEDTIADLYRALEFIQTGEAPRRIRRVIHTFKSGR